MQIQFSRTWYVGRIIKSQNGAIKSLLCPQQGEREREMLECQRVSMRLISETHNGSVQCGSDSLRGYVDHLGAESIASDLISLKLDDL